VKREDPHSAHFTRYYGIWVTTMENEIHKHVYVHCIMGNVRCDREILIGREDRKEENKKIKGTK
jgi:hypothetical protein